MWNDASQVKSGFKMIIIFYFCHLGEQGVANAKADLETTEGKELKLVKELKKLNKRRSSSTANTPSSTAEVQQQLQLNEVKDKLEQATREKELAKIDVDDKVREQEAIKMIRFKVGFNRLLIGYLDMAEKVSDILSFRWKLK